MGELIFKYAPHTKFFGNGLFRFTQPSALNDPEEALPVVLFEDYAPEDFAVARARMAGSVVAKSLNDDEFVRRFALMPFGHRMDHRTVPGLWPAKVPELREEAFETIEELDRAYADRAVSLARQRADETLGIFSLSTSTAEPMWAYYAGDHSGVCVRFHKSHPFFDSRLRPVEYSEKSIYVSVNQGMVRLAGISLSKDQLRRGIIADIPDALLFRKRSTWAHECEWRMIEKLVNADTQPHVGIFLFKIPPDAFHSIVFGYKATEDTIAEAVSIAAGGPFRHVPIYKRTRGQGGTMAESLVALT
ncbi:DUF2971 domain-containing protein [Mesorhizobium sp. IMUNJ 23232]|uniref:DUF2971 domain-containing protein n=1 Tax=Mesorhizobium sp. IMUNJ 23232 TaxID=3376064 RepID=UPI0037A10D57